MLEASPPPQKVAVSRDLVGAADVRFTPGCPVSELLGGRHSSAVAYWQALNFRNTPSFTSYEFGSNSASIEKDRNKTGIQNTV